VVFFHGFTGDRMESHWLFVKCARALAGSGIASLRFDFSGSGESEGEFREVTLEGEISDAQAAVEFFRQQNGIDAQRLGLLGLSMGGAIAATLAPASDIHALVLWAALAHPGELHELAQKTTSLIPGGNGARDYGGHEISPDFLHNLAKIEPIRSIARFKGPVLIIHPGKDEYLSPAHPEAYWQAAGAPTKEKVIVPGADHTFSSVAWEREVIERSVKWFAKFL
jgi:alpha/beta superfamily hydrolase